MADTSSPKPDKVGYLHKRSEWLKEWRRRYFQLVGSNLYFSKSPQDEPHGVIDLTKCLTVKSANDRTARSHSLELSTHDATYYMFAEDEQTKDDWIGAIGSAIVRYGKSVITDEAGPAEDEHEDDDDDDLSSDDGADEGGFY